MILESIQQTEFTQLPIVFLMKDQFLLFHVDEIVHSVVYNLRYSYQRSDRYRYAINEISWSIDLIDSHRFHDHFTGRKREIPFFDHDCFESQEDFQAYLRRHHLDDLLSMDLYSVVRDQFDMLDFKEREIDSALSVLDERW